MAELHELPSLLSAAEQAAAAADHASAAAILREVAETQESHLGPLHPDLANTLNNLGVVCEMAGDTSGAEHFFRRAYAIATATLDPDHPFFATSRRNLEDFCKATGVPLDDRPPVVPPSAAEREDPLDAFASQPLAPPRAARHSRQSTDVTALDDFHPGTPVTPAVAPAAPAARVGPGPLVIASLLGAAILAALLITRPWTTGDGVPDTAAAETETADGAAAAASPPDISPPDTPRAAEPATEPAAAAPTVTEAPQEPAAVPPPPVSPPPAPEPAPEPSAATTAGGTPVIVDARLCRDFATGAGAWRCVPATSPADPGRLTFYTRIRVPRDTTIEHRWYRGDSLYQSVTLRIRANMAEGFRTYSHQTVSAGVAADWRVELRAADGAVVHAEAFSVR